MQALGTGLNATAAGSGKSDCGAGAGRGFWGENFLSIVFIFI
jgi:hypothetical protein